MFSQISPQARRAMFFGAAAMAIYLLMMFGTLARLQAISGLKPFDLRPGGYAQEDAHALLGALGEVGRGKYFERQLVLDALYPGLLALTLSNLFLVIGNGLNIFH